MEILGVLIVLLISIIISIPVSMHIERVMKGEKNFLSRLFLPIEKLFYKYACIDFNYDMSSKEYIISSASLSVVGMFFLFFLFIFQGMIPILNPQKFSGLTWDLALNSAISFVTNTGWRPYYTEANLSYFSQIIGVTVQNFIAPAVGLCVLFALIRGIKGENGKGLGNFWVDLTRAILYIFVPFALIVSILLISQGVIQNFNAYTQAQLLENVFLGNGENITSQIIPQGPVAGQVAIGRIGNLAGFFGASAAHPLENPTPVSNAVQIISMLVLPISLCFLFAKAVKSKIHGVMLISVMTFLSLFSIFGIMFFEKISTQQLIQEGDVDTSCVEQSGGNMEGKESRFGIIYSSVYTSLANATSNGSLSSVVNSYTPLGGLLAIMQIQLSGFIFGGIGSGLYKMVAFIIVSLFILSLVVGRKPCYCGKRISDFDVKMSALVCLVSPILSILGITIACAMPETLNSVFNIGPHAMTELIYNFSSISCNNGSAFYSQGFNTLAFNLITGIIMMAGRFIPMFAILSIADSFSKKEKDLCDTVSLNLMESTTFYFVLVLSIVSISTLFFLSAWIIGPIVEFLQMI